MSVTYTDILWFLLIGTIGSIIASLIASLLYDLWATFETKRRLKRMAMAQKNVAELIGRRASK
jgi:uncharacterized membrane protein YccC